MPPEQYREWSELDSQMCDTTGIETMSLSTIHERLIYLHQMSKDYEDSKTDWCPRHFENVLFSIQDFYQGLMNLYTEYTGFKFVQRKEG